jgi:hypothetical protein
MKNVMYVFNGDPTTQEEEIDMDDDVLKLAKGRVIERNGKQWKVLDIQTTIGVSTPKPIDVVRVYLTGPIG